MGYPIFSVDENGQLVESGMVSDDNGELNSVLQNTESVESDSFEDESVLEFDSVSGNDAVPVTYTYDSPALVELQSDVAYLASETASSSGYLSSSALDVFDRVVESLDYNYYCAFRYDNDSYNAVLFLSDKISRNGSVVSLSDAKKVQLYRVASGSGYNYSYYYSVIDVGDVDIQLGDNLMYYTNCLVGYPALGSLTAPGHYPAWIPLVLLVGLVIAFFTFKRR